MGGAGCVLHSSWFECWGLFWWDWWAWAWADCRLFVAVAVQSQGFVLSLGELVGERGERGEGVGG